MKNNYCHISIVLDRSGSMSSIKDDTIGGFNQFLKSQKEAPGEATISLYQFDDVYETLYEFTDIQKSAELTNQTFIPRNSTALLDAIAQTIDKTGEKLAKMDENNRPSKVLIVIITDGEENCSKKFNKNQVFDKITHQKNNYSWEFVYIGANQDAIATAAGMGIGANSTITYAASSIGTQSVYSSLSNSSTMFRSAGNSAASFSFTEEDKKRQQEELDKNSI